MDINYIYGDEFNNNLTGGSGRDFISGFDGNDILSGNGGRDTLHGGSGDDLLRGESGNDSLHGTGGGIDRMIGGSGSDNFYLGRTTFTNTNTTLINNTGTPFPNDYYREANSHAVIEDFVKGEDLIRVRGSTSDYQITFDGIDGNVRTFILHLQGNSDPLAYVRLENNNLDISDLASA